MKKYLFTFVLGLLMLSASPAFAGSRVRISVPDGTNLLAIDLMFRGRQVMCMTTSRGKLIPGTLRTKKEKRFLINLSKKLKKRIQRSTSKKKKKKLRIQRRAFLAACKAAVAGGTGNDNDNDTDIPIPLPPSEPIPENAIFVDGTLSATCIGGYEHSTRTCEARSDLNDAYLTPQEAADVTVPGDTVLIRGGTYLPSTPLEVSVVLEITRSGTPNNPITFRAYQDLDTSAYEEVILDSELVGRRWALFMHNASYVVLDGLKATGGNAGGFRFGGSSIYSSIDEPVHHIAVRNSAAYDNGVISAAGTGGFTVVAASHDMLFERDEAYNNNGGFWIGTPHQKDKSKLPYNITVTHCLAHSNIKGGGNSNGIVFMGAHNSRVSHSVAHSNSDTGIGSQGPHADNNVYEYLVAYDTTPFFGHPGEDGNARGFQFGNVNDSLGVEGYAGGKNDFIHHIISFDNHTRGFVDAQGSHNARYYHALAFRNNRAGGTDNWGFLFESQAGIEGASNYPEVTKGATLKNSVSYQHGSSTDIAASSRTVPNMSHNFVGDGSATGLEFRSGDPKFADPANIVVDTNLYVGAPALRIPNPDFGKVLGLEPAPGSPLIDAGDIIAGFHCPVSDDSNSNQSDCVHWSGGAPDIGAYEFIP